MRKLLTLFCAAVFCIAFAGVIGASYKVNLDVEKGYVDVVEPSNPGEPIIDHTDEIDWERLREIENEQVYSEYVVGTDRPTAETTQTADIIE